MAGYGSGLYGRGNYGIDPKEGAASLSAAASVSCVGVRVRLGAAALSGAATLTATCNRVQPGASSMSATATQTAAAVIVEDASASLSASGALSCSARIVRDGAAAMAGTASLAASALRVRLGAAAVSGAATVAADALRVRLAASAMSGAATETATGVRVRIGAAALSGAASQTATANVVYIGAAALAAEAAPVREQHTPGLRRVDRDVGRDRVGAVADVDRLGLGGVGDIGVVDVAVAWAGQLWPRCVDDLDRGSVVEREGAVVSGLGEPQVHQLADFFRVFSGEVVQLGPVEVRLHGRPRHARPRLRCLPLRARGGPGAAAADAQLSGLVDQPLAGRGACREHAYRRPQPPARMRLRAWQRT